MKTILTAVALATLLSTPALANKVFIGDKSDCDIKQDIELQKMIDEVNSMIIDLEKKRDFLSNLNTKVENGVKITK